MKMILPCPHFKETWNAHAHKALARQTLWRHLALLGLAQSKRSGLAQACTGQAQAALDGAAGLV